MNNHLNRFTTEGFISDWWQEGIDGRCHGVADGDIDADGANGQFGHKPAYAVGDLGSEFLINGGMKMSKGKVVVAKDWARDIVIFDKDGVRPREFPGGIIASRTAYRFPDKAEDDPEAYVDAETFPYIVVSPILRARAKGVVLGCRARATFQGRSVDAGVLDIGPRYKIGELSIAAARTLGINPSPRTGGVERPLIEYEFWPNQPAVLNGVTFRLVPG